MKHIVIHVHYITQEWFYSTDYCQPDISENWFPIAYAERVWTKEQVEMANNKGLMILNPNPKYQPEA